jgi:hypothetical protein
MDMGEADADHAEAEATPDGHDDQDASVDAA